MGPRLPYPRLFSMRNQIRLSARVVKDRRIGRTGDEGQKYQASHSPCMAYGCLLAISQSSVMLNNGGCKV